MSLRAGAAEVDITPPIRAMLGGAFQLRRQVESVLDPLFARALVLDLDGRRVCIVTLDVCILNEPYASRIRRRIGEALDIAPEAIMVHALQDHSAPSMGPFILSSRFPVPPEFEWLRGGDGAFAERATAGAIEAAIEAGRRLEPVVMGFGSGIEGRIAHNRRAVAANGRVGMPWWRVGWAGKPYPPGGPFRYLEGPIDPEVGVASFRRPSGKIVALLLHYTCHPVNLFSLPELTVSADWPGAWCREMRALAGADCVPLVINGCCGNVNPFDPFDPDYRPDHLRMGRLLAETAGKVLRDLDYATPDRFDWRLTRIDLPLRQAPPEELRKAEALLRAHPEPQTPRGTPDEVTLDWIYAALMKDFADELIDLGPTMAYEVQALRVGDLALLGLPGEPFTEGALAIKMQSPARRTFIAHCTTHYAGYLPTREAYARGGHETIFGPWSRFQPGALEQVVEAAGTALGGMFREGKETP